MTSRTKQKLGGLVFGVIGAGFTAWNWYTALHEGYFYQKTSMIFPAILVLGLGLFLFPAYREERIARGEDISEMQGLSLITPRWWIIIALAAVAGCADYLLLSAQ